MHVIREDLIYRWYVNIIWQPIKSGNLTDVMYVIQTTLRI